MDQPAVRYTVLRDRQHWELAGCAGLQQQADGAFALIRLPGQLSGIPITLPEPYAVSSSGFALGTHGDSYASDAEHQRVVANDCLCKVQKFFYTSDSGTKNPPLQARGLQMAGDTLYIADGAASCVYLLHLPQMELRGCWPTPLQTPVALACDSKGHIYVLDQGLKQVLRFNADGSNDDTYNRVMALHVFEEPYALAIDATDCLLVADAGTANRVLRFNASGLILAALPNPGAAGPQQPRALAISGLRLYVADAATGRIFLFDAGTDAWLGSLPAYRGPVSAMAVGPDGALYIKPAADDTVYKLDADADCVASGDLLAGPLDAGELTQWERVWLEAEIPPQTGVSLEYAVSDTLTRGPWITAPALDCLVQPFVTEPAAKRYLWLQISLLSDQWGSITRNPLTLGGNHVELNRHTGRDSRGAILPHALRLNANPLPSDLCRYPEHMDVNSDMTIHGNWVPAIPAGTTRQNPNSTAFRASPRLLQVQAHTVAPGYQDYLPEVYSRKDTEDAFLARLLALFRAELGDWESALDDAPKTLDPRLASDDQLQTIAGLLGFELPAIQSTKNRRELLLNVHDLYRQRGTLAGLRKFIELYTGVTPHIFEAFRERRIWQLGETSLLGFDTALPAGLPEGFVVPGFNLPDPGLMGLNGDYFKGGDYYQGTLFDHFVNKRTDSTINFAWAAQSPWPNVIPADHFSVRWSGQVQTRFSETYTFHTESDEGVRLWVDGKLIIDNWTLHSATPDHGTIALQAGRWYAIVLEFFEQGGHATIRLGWSSASQRYEIIPRECLYAIIDETVPLNSGAAEAANEPLLHVGRVVVGENTAQPAADFGAPFFADTAHLFTVVVPGALFPRQEQRARLREAIEAEKPAYTDFHLCFTEAPMRLGFQARLGIDSIVAGPPPPMMLDEATLELNTYLADGDQGHPKARVGQRAHLGVDTIIN